MHRVRLIHWQSAGAQERAGLRRLREDPPDAVVIDLSRVPSQGRDLALNLRKYKATRRVPLVFVEGAPEKVARVKELLPDAVYTTWDEAAGALAEAIAHPPADPVVPVSTMAGYSGTPLPKKLGIKAGSRVALAGAPEGFESTLGRLPDGAVLHRGTDDRAGVTLWFVTSREELEREIETMGAFAQKGGLWIIWPKKASGVASDVSQNVVRQVGLASGLVDFKVASIDATWSGLRFTQRK